MLPWVIPLILLFSFEAQARRPLGHWTELVPESRAHRYFGQADDLALDPSSIKTLVWNIKKTQKAEWQREFLNYSENQDLVLLQEGFQGPRFNSTIERLPEFRWDMAVSFLLRKSNRAATGTMIGSIVPPSFVLAKQTEDFEPIVNTPKATIFAKYPIAGTQQELLVISFHGINLTSHSTFQRHLQQARAQILAHHGPVFFAGDFNTRSQARTSYLMSAMSDLNLTPVTFKNGDRRMVWKFTRNYLDHGFVRGLKVLSAEVLAEARGSDHKPMVLELAFEQENP